MEKQLTKPLQRSMLRAKAGTVSYTHLTSGLCIFIKENRSVLKKNSRMRHQGRSNT